MMVYEAFFQQGRASEFSGPYSSYFQVSESKQIQLDRPNYLAIPNPKNGELW